MVKFQNTQNSSLETLNQVRRGQELREEEKIWKGVASSESRIKLMKIMIKQGIAFADLEEFGQEFKDKIKSTKMKNKMNVKNNLNSVTSQAMKIKLADEQNLRRELVKVKSKMRRDLMKEMNGENSIRFKKTMSHLTKIAKETKEELTKKYKYKVEHLTKKYSEKNTDAEFEVPEGLEDYMDLSVFSKTKYENIEIVEYEVKTVGEVTLSSEEKEVLKLHNKFSVIGNLHKGDLDDEQEASLAKIRMEKSKEMENEDYTTQEKEQQEELEAEARMVFNPREGVYDSRKRRVTDLKECARVTLPKPLTDDEESKLEVRKRFQKEVFEKYRRENTNKYGEQKSNLTKTEQKGLKSLKKRIENEEILVMKTDKSSKFVVTTPEDYKEMGKEHIEKDEEIDMGKVKELEKEVNQHTIAWSLIWSTGENHGHMDRVVKSKVTRSGNQANLSLLYKDHKAGNKTRPVASGNESNNLGLSNGVSEVLEAVSKGKIKPYSVISSEDMLARMAKYNKIIDEKNEEWLVIKAIKITCEECKVLEKLCTEHVTREELEKLENWDDIKIKVEETFSKECCKIKAYNEIREGCKKCGKGLKMEQMTMSLVGSDVVALYPSLTSKRTG